MSRDRGALALLLHTHMPYVEGFGTWPFGEEWLWEAVATVYLPLARVLEGAPVTIGLTPVLCDQLETLPGEPGRRLAGFLRGVRAEIHAEDSAGLERGGERELAAEVRRAAGDYVRADEDLEACGGDVLGALAALATNGPAELWTSAATHALLPMLATDAGRRLQLATGVAAHERRFGGFEGGLWLPECAYEPGLERDLSEHGVRAFCVDQTDLFGLGAAAHLEPVVTEAGPVALPLDWGAVELVWNNAAGYPVASTYRNYWGRTTHDLRPWNNGGQPYRHEDALALAAEHARDFVGRAVARLDRYAEERRRPGLICCALDTELLGHWWYEGPAWLAAVLDEAPRQGLELVTASEGIELAEPVERSLAASTWGTDKDFSTWDAPGVADLAWSARGAELRTVAAAARPGGPREPLMRAARELLAIQASDWAFMVSRRLAGDSPQERVSAHQEAHAGALGALLDGAAAPAPELRHLAPDLDLSPLVAP